jgi:Fe-S-cluster containining protein
VITYWLSHHLAYRCRHSGACCSVRWPIPIERERADRVSGAIARGEVAPAPVRWLRPAPGAPDDIAGLLTQCADGHCVFHRSRGVQLQPDESRRCAIHADRPSSCEHFPFVCLLDARGVHVTLSHYCPTVARLLLTADPVRVVEGPPVFASGRVPEGLDARESLPPVDQWAEPSRTDRPRLMSWDDVSAWERALVADVAQGAGVPAPDCPPDDGMFEHARAAVPAPLSWPEAPPRLAAAWARRVAPAWPTLAPIVRRYLAARAFASWALYLGDGPRDVLGAVALAATVLRVEAVRQCVVSGRGLDAALLIEAVRQSDLLLAHYADPARLTRRS